MSSPPSCSRATATARRAPSGVERSPAAARASTPRAANSCARSASAPAFTSAITRRAPASPNPSATAWPICPTRPTPVTRATLPCRSGGTVRPVCRRDDLAHGRRAALGEHHRTVTGDHVDRPLDADAVVLEGVIGARERAIPIGEQREVEVHLLHVAGVRVHPRSEEHTSELQSPDHLVCRLLLEKKKK